MRKFWIVPLLVLLVSAGASRHPSSQFGISTEELRIRATVMDYVEGIYDRDADRMARSLHPDVRRHVQVADENATSTLDRQELIALAGSLCDVQMPRRGPKRVLLYELRDNVAAVKLTAAWGVDLLHLSKEDGRWRIVGIVGTAPRSLMPTGDAA